jgi:hypothetical protein
MKTKKKKKETALFLKDNQHRQVSSGQYQFQAQDSTGWIFHKIVDTPNSQVV